jgi:mRNA interferase RelE/StbE
VKRYELQFGRHALKQWLRLDLSIRKQFTRKLDKILDHPHVLSTKMHGYKDAYRVKLRKAGYRLGYRVLDEKVVVVVISVGVRDKNRVFDFALYYHEGDL